MSNQLVTFPNYPSDFQLAGKVIPSILLSKKRSFRIDALNWIKDLKPPLVMFGKENLPQKGPFLLVINHYYRSGYKAWWSVLAASALIPVEIHWVMAAAWTFPERPMGVYLETISRRVYKRIADTYGFFNMPPMPPRAWEIEARALAVRQIFGYVRKNPGAAIGLAPEGGDSPSGRLEMPAPGVGRLLLHLAGSGLVIHPLGIYEADGSLHLNFGKSLEINCPVEFSSDERDRWCRQFVMQSIGNLLPHNLRGAFL